MPLGINSSKVVKTLVKLGYETKQLKKADFFEPPSETLGFSSSISKIGPKLQAYNCK